MTFWREIAFNFHVKRQRKATILSINLEEGDTGCFSGRCRLDAKTESLC